MIQQVLKDFWNGSAYDTEEYRWRSEQDAMSAVGDLDGYNKTIVIMCKDKENRLTVGGGNDGRYVCYADKGPKIFNLVRSAVDTGTTVSIVAGGQPGDYPEKLCSDRQMVESAVLYYIHHGGLNPDLDWEEA